MNNNYFPPAVAFALHNEFTMYVMYLNIFDEEKGQYLFHNQITLVVVYYCFVNFMLQNLHPNYIIVYI